MANPWFRLYSEFDSDPKVQLMPETMQRRLIMLLCGRCKEETFQERFTCFKWRISLDDLAETKAIFLSHGFIDDDWNVLNWNKRQYVSDSSTDRVRRHRLSLEQGETLQERPVSVTVTAPEQNRAEQNQNKSRKKHENVAIAPSVDFPEWWPHEAWRDFIDFRKKGKRPLTTEGVKRAIEKIAKLRDQGHNPIFVLNQSVDRGWSGVFPVDELRDAVALRPLPAAASASLGHNPNQPMWDDATALATIRKRQASGDKVSAVELKLADEIERSLSYQNQMAFGGERLDKNGR